ncbi:MAG TPA: alkyl sulfatase dimerization domain-containing protein [Actinomycetota bacterium]|nr:alkyl sulfatase dimerization domain-containing protein [Actinomycetota bacterium]
MPDALALAESLLREEISPEEARPFSFSGDLVEVADGVAFVPSFANVTAVRTDDELVLIDTGSPLTADIVHTQVRAWSRAPVRTAIYTHGHIDHVFGVGPFEAEGPVRVVAHENVAARFDRYRKTAGYNAVINRRQFRLPDLEWPTEYRYPDESYRDELSFNVGGRRFELRHGKGETDDATWVFIPDRRVLCCGDFFIWAAPNAGNPQKVQRYPAEWAAALRAMATLDAESLLPGHGVPIVGADRVRAVLEDTASWLESLVEQTLEMINAGASLDAVLHTVKVPEHLASKPYLRATYDEPEFIVRNLWRLYAGWFDGDPSSLKPPPQRALALELADLAGGAAAIAKRAREVAAAGDLRLACTLAEIAFRAAPNDESALSARSDVYRRRAEVEPSLMAKSIYSWAADDARR